MTKRSISDDKMINELDASIDVLKAFLHTLVVARRARRHALKRRRQYETSPIHRAKHLARGKRRRTILHPVWYEAAE